MGHVEMRLFLLRTECEIKFVGRCCCFSFEAMPVFELQTVRERWVHVGEKKMFSWPQPGLRGWPSPWLEGQPEGGHLNPQHALKSVGQTQQCMTLWKLKRILNCWFFSYLVETCFLCILARVRTCRQAGVSVSACFLFSEDVKERPDQPSQRWIKPDFEAVQGSGAFVRKMGNSPLSHKEPLEFIDETNVFV